MYAPFDVQLSPPWSSAQKDLQYRKSKWCPECLGQDVPPHLYDKVHPTPGTREANKIHLACDHRAWRRQRGKSKSTHYLPHSPAQLHATAKIQNLHLIDQGSKHLCMYQTPPCHSERTNFATAPATKIPKRTKLTENIATTGHMGQPHPHRSSNLHHWCSEGPRCDRSQTKRQTVAQKQSGRQSIWPEAKRVQRGLRGVQPSTEHKAMWHDCTCHTPNHTLQPSVWPGTFILAWASSSKGSQIETSAFETCYLTLSADGRPAAEIALETTPERHGAGWPGLGWLPQSEHPAS